MHDFKIKNMTICTIGIIGIIDVISFKTKFVYCKFVLNIIL